MIGEVGIELGHRLTRIDLGEVPYREALGDLGFPTVRRDTPKGENSLVGIWTPEHHKLVSIGMRIRGGVTSHGFALNVDPDLSVYDRFTACRLEGVTMTSLRRMADEREQRLPGDNEIRDAITARLGP
jgi:lipoyl(octanoyl) transferase